ncbi:S-adenosyl-L-methionine-dependent methyltransferase [Calycina marina]|uniref:tRNA (guanine(26)-N(2))-dimethyltransferase n=1 Tax=Calycina marina TaxID=1763456 RepID=A0A9P7Z2G9_9HELO|nr:S-adenosyl-L-methionine-dependent methyltransferase [Calycina marina]
MENPKDISATPAHGQRISHDGREYTTIKEGLAYILIPADASAAPQTTPNGDNQAQSVFYNPIQQFNRDLSVLAIKAYGEEVIEKKLAVEKKEKEAKGKKRLEKKRKRAGDELNPDISRKASRLDGKGTAMTVSAQNGHIVNTTDTQEAQGDGILQVSEQEAKSSVEEPKDDIPDTSAEEPAKEVQQSEVKSKSPAFTILDALSATGLRALRYVHEIPFTTSVTANDLLPAATKTINLNVQHNNLDGKIKSITGNAMTHMYNVAGSQMVNKMGRVITGEKYDVIDLDPYGTAAPFLDSAVQGVRDDGGLLCVTCTDAGVWASNGYPEKAYSLYGGIPIKGLHSHEGGLRLILHAIATSAARYGLAMEPLLSLSIDFYARVFVRIHKSAADVKFLAGKTMVVYNCDVGCGAWSTQMVGKNKLSPNKSGNGYFWKHVFEQGPSGSNCCEHCGMKRHMAGPMFAGPLHSPHFIKRILAGLPNVSKDTYHTTERIEGMLNLALEETLPLSEGNLNSPTATSKTGKYDPATIDHYPFFFIPSVLAKVIHCITPHENALRGALKNLGYRVTRSHTKPGSIRTDAPWDVVWEIMRQWMKQKAPAKEGAIRSGTAGWNILGMGDSTKDQTEGVESADVEANNTKPEIIFDEALGKEKGVKKLVRYQTNPRENWGPMNRATGRG